VTEPDRRHRPGRQVVALEVSGLEVADDGVGIRPGDEDRAIRGCHLGLVDMRSRAAAIGAALQVGRHPGGGTLVLLRWPA
jgi:signal transduction histidine kinase